MGPDHKEAARENACAAAASGRVRRPRGDDPGQRQRHRVARRRPRGGLRGRARRHRRAEGGQRRRGALARRGDGAPRGAGAHPAVGHGRDAARRCSASARSPPPHRGWPCSSWAPTTSSRSCGARHVPGREPLLTSLSLALLAARRSGIAILDGVYNDVTDLDGFEAECRQGRDLGFDGKTLIHPGQVEPCNAVFAPSAEEVEEARELLAAWEAGAGRGRRDPPREDGGEPPRRDRPQGDRDRRGDPEPGLTPPRVGALRATSRSRPARRLAQRRPASRLLVVRCEHRATDGRSADRSSPTRGRRVRSATAAARRADRLRSRTVGRGRPPGRAPRPPADGATPRPPGPAAGPRTVDRLGHRRAPPSEPPSPTPTPTADSDAHADARRPTPDRRRRRTDDRAATPTTPSRHRRSRARPWSAATPGPKVLALQQRLEELGYWLGEPDGAFGSLTQQAVWAFQKSAGLERDGVVGPTDAAGARGRHPARRPRSAATASRSTSTARSCSSCAAATVRTDPQHLDRQRRGVHLDLGQPRHRDDAAGQVHASTGPSTARSPTRSAQLWRPRFFHRGIAVHGSRNIPPWPDSHGCARLSNAAIDMIWAARPDAGRQPRRRALTRGHRGAPHDRARPGTDKSDPLARCVTGRASSATLAP